jgi:hypothetical protein
MRLTCVKISMPIPLRPSTSGTSRPSTSGTWAAHSEQQIQLDQRVMFVSGRLLDPKDGNVTITTLQRAANIVGRTLRVELV